MTQGQNDGQSSRWMISDNLATALPGDHVAPLEGTDFMQEIKQIV
jgi:hypothetical protein